MSEQNILSERASRLENILLEFYDKPADKRDMKLLLANYKFDMIDEYDNDIMRVLKDYIRLVYNHLRLNTGLTNIQLKNMYEPTIPLEQVPQDEV